MTAVYIHKFAKACEAVYETRDPEEILRLRYARIKESAPCGLRGMICMVSGGLIVSIDPELPGSVRRSTEAHMLGHALLHKKRLESGEAFEEPSVQKEADASEREADFFAAELLIKDEEIITLRESGMSEGQIVSSFGTIRDLVIHKLFSMRSRGISVGDEVCRADFLRRCDVELFF